MRGHLRGLVTRGGHGYILGGGIRLRRLDEDLPYVGEANETEDMFQILALLIPACVSAPASSAACRASVFCDPACLPLAPKSPFSSTIARLGFASSLCSLPQGWGKPSAV